MEVSEEYANAYAEVWEILKYLCEEDFKKIPKEKLEVFDTFRNKTYVFTYDPNRTLDEQHVSKIAKTIIGILFRDYWATPKQREAILKKQDLDRKRLKLQKYGELIEDDD